MASVLTWVTQGLNQKTNPDIDFVKENAIIRIPRMTEFAANFNPADPRIKELDRVPDESNARAAAVNKANDIYLKTIGGQ